VPFYETQTIKLHDTTPPAVLLAGGAAGRKRHKRTYFPAAAEIKFLLDFFVKKSRVQGGALPLPAQGRM